jgi:hypothetical protein
MEEIKNTEAIEEVIEATDVMPEFDGSNKNLVGVIVGLGSVAVATAVGLAIKHRDKLDEWRVRKLEKKGYTVTKPIDVEVEDDIEEELE